MILMFAWWYALGCSFEDSLLAGAAYGLLHILRTKPWVR